MAGVTCDMLQVNGKPLIPPDADVDFSYEDLDDSTSGRDEAGVMHRIVIRYKVMSGSFVFSNISPEDYKYMESIFPDEPDFEFTHPDRHDFTKTVTSTCYRSKHNISWVNARTGKVRNYKFKIVEC